MTNDGQRSDPLRFQIENEMDLLLGRAHPNPTREELAHGISGNLCRCADYNKILNAFMRGAEYLRKA